MFGPNGLGPNFFILTINLNDAVSGQVGVKRTPGPCRGETIARERARVIEESSDNGVDAKVLGTTQPCSALGFPRLYSKPAYAVKVGIPEFLGGIGGGVETHIAKLETKIGDLNKLLVTRTLKLKKFGIPCKHRKLILKYAHKYRLGLWKPRADAIRA
ncbi:PREDICTED: uncharacterized protein LOC104821881 [Tarenaya hassleriana]|uniref:uncharacterized protein LOC104821881 n=1 Tax=Tarenaya hassleriana TaxID=28532 RepID=UPI00053C4BCB|nr:PREDICTED: uncharacterized protein LOC104821881 [Tarenaya hassleriana]